jgi:hypothetical protein
MQADRECSVGINLEEFRRLAALGRFSSEVLDQPDLLQVFYNVEYRLVGQTGETSDLNSRYRLV